MLGMIHFIFYHLITIIYIYTICKDDIVTVYTFPCKQLHVQYITRIFVLLHYILIDYFLLQYKHRV